MEKSVERSLKDQHGGKDDSRKIKKRPAVASAKPGPARCTNRDKLLGFGDRGVGKSQQQSNPKQVSKLHQPPMTKRKLQKTAGAGPGPKAPSVNNLKGKNQITEGAPSYNLRNKAQKTENQKASVNIPNRKAPKKDGSKDSSVATQKTTGVLKNSAKPIRKTETAKHLTSSPADLGKKNRPSTSQHDLFSREPIYHIRWKGDDMKNGPLGQNCILCSKDLSCVTEDDDSDSDDSESDDSESDDDSQYDVGDESYDDLNPDLLPAVGILSCGHAYHIECLQKDTTEEQSSDPRCILCDKLS